MKEQIISILDNIKKLKKDKTNTLPGNVFYLDNEDILCLEREDGICRYPYEMDGMNLWVNSEGYINANEGSFYIFQTDNIQDSPCIEFWGGIKLDENTWFPISILGATKQLFEPVKVDRYVVFQKRAAFYIAETPDIIFAVRAHITTSKKINFTVSAISKGKNKKSTYLASYIKPLVRNVDFEQFWDRLGMFGDRIENGNYIYSVDKTDYAIINRSFSENFTGTVESTSSKSVFIGAVNGTICNAKSLKRKKFNKEIHKVNTTNIPVMADIISFETEEEIFVNYLCSRAKGEAAALETANQNYDINQIEEDIKKQTVEELQALSSLDLHFEEMEKMNNVLFNRFLKNVQKQVDLCALGKNYVGSFLGMRDVFQQLDTSIIWNPQKSRAKIINCLNYIFSTGRPPREFSIPDAENEMPKFNTKEYIDQGVWIIETLYNYLAFTDDYSILEEECSYYDIVDMENKIFKRGAKDTVLDHILKIMEYLISNIDSETNCLKILYGDWNDAFNGLGKTNDKDKEFGNGVSVMASTQLYRNFEEMIEILTKIGKYPQKCEEYNAIRNKMGDALEKYALEQTKDGETHIVHGWGDKQSYKACTLKDSDGKRRYSATSNSFWCISGMIKRNPEIKNDIMKAYNHLDSKYGIKTFEPFMTTDIKNYGRIVYLTPGTYENAAAYVHSTMFAVTAMFVIGESEQAWEQIKKAIPITHKNVTKTSFVMPNSYCYNEEYNMDGESMGDWYTGSGAVLLRNIIKFALGIQPTLRNLMIKPASFMPSKRIALSLFVKSKKINLIYKNEGKGKRTFVVNGNVARKYADEVSGDEYILIQNEELSDSNIIEVID